MAKAKANLFILSYEYSEYVNKPIGIDLVSKGSGRESSLKISVMAEITRVLAANIRREI